MLRSLVHSEKKVKEQIVAVYFREDVSVKVVAMVDVYKHIAVAMYSRGFNNSRVAGRSTRL